MAGGGEEQEGQEEGDRPQPGHRPSDGAQVGRHQEGRPQAGLGTTQTAQTEGHHNLFSLLSYLLSLQMPEDVDNIELYDVIKDPNETTNLVGQYRVYSSHLTETLKASARPDKVERLKGQLEELMREAVSVENIK